MGDVALQEFGRLWHGHGHPVSARGVTSGVLAQQVRQADKAQPLRRFGTRQGKS
jgi:hypothetical protein